MSRTPKPLFTVTTPIPTVLGAVTLYEHTWLNHIIVNHPEVIGLLPEIEATITNPSLILASATAPGSYLFINTTILDPQSRPLRIPVKPIKPLEGIVASAYFSSNVKQAGTIVWQPPPPTKGKPRK